MDGTARTVSSRRRASSRRFASERGASANTIEAYRRDLADYEAYLKTKGCGRAEGGRNACARVSRGARRAEAERRVAGAPSVGDPSVSQVSLCRRVAARRSDAGGRGPAPIAPAAEALEHGRGRAPDRDRARRPRPRGAPVARAPGRGAHRLSHRAHLRVGLARVGSLELSRSRSQRPRPRSSRCAARATRSAWRRSPGPRAPR